MLGAICGGVAGATALTLVHQAARQALADAPRMDVLGERAIAKGARAVGVEPPAGERLEDLALAGDLVSNSAYYALVGLGGSDGAIARGAALGLAAGLGAVLLPGPLGLGTAPGRRTPQTAAMTVAWYTLGGLVAGAVCRALAADGDSR